MRPAEADERSQTRQPHARPKGAPPPSAESAGDVVLRALLPGGDEYLLCRPDFDHFAEIEERHLVGAACGLLQIVRDERDGHVLLQVVDQNPRSSGC